METRTIYYARNRARRVVSFLSYVFRAPMYASPGRGVVRHRRVAVVVLLWLSWSPFATSAGPVNVGTALYTRRDLTKVWTEPEAVRLRVRQMVDRLLPTRVPDGPAFVQYMKSIADKSKIIENDATRRRAMVAVADAVGGYMHGVLLPNVKASYYEGRARFDATNRLYGTMRKIRCVRRFPFPSAVRPYRFG